VSASDDLALVQRFLHARAEDAFRDLYRAQTPALYGLALRLTGADEGEAEDLVQECWVRATRLLPSFRGQSALRSWLSGVLINVRRERIRTAWRTVDAPDLDPPARPSADDATLDLERAIAALPPGARDVFVLHDVYGYTHLEIAGMLDVATGTSKSQLTRARTLLRTSLFAEGRP
jgi:RNA polymerase sigma factor (sigma-70 family)